MVLQIQQLLGFLRLIAEKIQRHRHYFCQLGIEVDLLHEYAINPRDGAGARARRLGVERYTGKCSPGRLAKDDQGFFKMSSSCSARFSWARS